jgi:putative ABC transport system substrate-binding protein
VTIRRRKILVAGVALLAAPHGLYAQTRERHYRIGVIGNIPPTTTDGAYFDKVFVEALRSRGYAEGTNLTIERRYAEGRIERYPTLAADIVRSNVDVIVVGSGPGVRAAKEATGRIPIVMNGVSDPVAAGVISSLAHPGGNVTGIADLQVDLIPKRLELLKAAAPKISQVLFLYGRFGGFQPAREAAIEQEQSAAAQRLAVTLLRLEMSTPKDFEMAAASIVRLSPDALLLSPNPTNYIVRKELADLAIKQKLPTIGGSREMAVAGILMSYGADYTDQLRKVAGFVDRILRGENAADLPVEQPTKFDLVINLATAKVLGLAIPQSLRQQATDAIQ